MDKRRLWVVENSTNSGREGKKRRVNPKCTIKWWEKLNNTITINVNGLYTPTKVQKDFLIGKNLSSYTCFKKITTQIKPH